MAEPREPLTERELEIVRLAGTGVGNKEIATVLHLSPNTVKVHLRNIFTKLEAKSRTEMTVIAARHGWISLQEIASDVDATSLLVQQPDILTRRREGLQIDDVSGSAPVTKPISDLALMDGISDSQITGRYAAAPNPEPLPALVVWQRVLLIVTVLIVVLLIALSIVPEQTSATSDFDPLRIGPSTLKTGMLIHGETARWFLRTPMPSARARSAAAELSGTVYLIGGEVNQSVTGEVITYRPTDNSWELLADTKITPVANSPAATLNGRIYMVGGTTSENIPTNRMESFDVNTKTWRSEPSLSYAIAGHALTSLAGDLYLFGGANSQGITSQSMLFSPGTGKWHALSAMPTPRTLAYAVSFGASIYVVGGYSNGHELPTCEVYSPTTDSWSTCAPMTVPRGGLGLIKLGNSLFAIGGGMTGFMGFNERYDPAANRWTAIDSPFSSDWQSIAVASNATEFYVFGGYSGGERLSLTYVYEVFASRVFVPAFQTSDDKQP